MNESNEPAAWYEASAGNDQGLIIEEGSGRNVAVTYDKADAPLIAAAPAMLAALQSIARVMDMSDPESDNFADSAADCLDALLNDCSDFVSILQSLGLPLDGSTGSPTVEGERPPLLLCPECKQSGSIYGRADCTFDPIRREWVVGDIEDEMDCTHCDWNGSASDLIEIDGEAV